MAQGAWSQSLGFSCGLGGWVCAWPRAAPIPPRPIPNRVVPGASAGKYCAGNRVGGEAAARTPRPPTLACADRRGVEQRQLVGLITQRSRVRIPPPLPAGKRLVDYPQGVFRLAQFCLLGLWKRMSKR